ncbi:MAG: transglutaminase domain-containing protein [Vicinamibacteria bacterium]|nr:transglutaminase domain-containing protein [Vicinamibacteria bacterium]
MRLFRPIPSWFSRCGTVLALTGWIALMGSLIRHTQLDARSQTIAGDLAQYGAAAQWKGVYYRGEKIGFYVTQTIPQDDGYEIQEDGRLRMLLLGVTTAARIHTSVRVSRVYQLRSFDFTLDSGTGSVKVSGRLDGLSLRLSIKNSAGERTQTKKLTETPDLSLNLGRRLASLGMSPGRRFTLSILDPATLRSAPMEIVVERRDLVHVAGLPTPAFRLRTEFLGLRTTSWITDVGEVVREESPWGLMIVKETPQRAIALAAPGSMHNDLARAVAVVPHLRTRIDDPTSVTKLKLRVKGIPESLRGPDLQGAGQSVSGDIVEIVDEGATSGPRDDSVEMALLPEPLIESDDPEILLEATRALEGITQPRVKAERLVRHVHSLLEKKPTISLPSAREVLRTRVGDCNEHAALYVALARAAGLPARMAVGLVHLLGAFYYHAWVEVFIEETPKSGRWIAVDPTFNQFPADATHLRLARGSLEQQAAITAAIGNLSIDILDVEFKPDSTPIFVGRPSNDLRPIDIPIPRRAAGRKSCWSRPES